MSKKLHSGIAEVAIASLIDYRKFTVVPNVYWGLGLRHECDMLVLDSGGRLTEVEIKMNMSDLKRDFNAKHKSDIISRLVYAFPESILKKAKPLIPSKCGIIVLQEVQNRWVAKWHRRAKHIHEGKPSESQVKKLLSLGCMRIWTLKSALYSKQYEKSISHQDRLSPRV